MGTRHKVRWSWRVSALLLGVVALGGSAAVASIPQGNVFNACRKSTTGALRVIDPAKGQKCASGEVFLRWSTWHYRSIWLSGSRYGLADVVIYHGATYIVRKAPPVGTVPTNLAYWGVVAARGLPGLPGLQGLPGVKGATGPQGLLGATGATGLPGLDGATGPTGAGADPVFAAINSNGTIASAQHVTSSVLSGGLSPLYTLTFDKNISACAVNAVSDAIVAIPVVKSHGATTVGLQFTLLSALLTQTGFEVTVTC